MKFSKIVKYVAFSATITNAQFLPQLKKKYDSEPPTEGKFFYLEMNSPDTGIELHIGSDLQELRVGLNTQR